MGAETAFDRQHKVPVILLADIPALWFLDLKHERDFSASMCEFLTHYSRQLRDKPKTHTRADPEVEGQTIFDYNCSYPSDFTDRGGPVPIQGPSRVTPLSPIVPHNFATRYEHNCRWKIHEYLFALLALRAVSLLQSEKVS